MPAIAAACCCGCKRKERLAHTHTRTAAGDFPFAFFRRRNGDFAARCRLFAARAPQPYPLSAQAEARFCTGEVGLFVCGQSSTAPASHGDPSEARGSKKKAWSQQRAASISEGSRTRHRRGEKTINREGQPSPLQHHGRRR